MKALTLTQPWATLIAIGAKKIETRSWPAPSTVKGLLAIHAAKGLSPVGGQRGLKEQCGVEPFCSVLNAAIKEHEEKFWRGEGVLKRHVEHPFMPLGAILAVARLLRCESTIGSAIWMPAKDSHEYAFGNYERGRWMWMLGDVVALPQPVRCNGGQRVWNVPETEAALVREQVVSTGKEFSVLRVTTRESHSMKKSPYAQEQAETHALEEWRGLQEKERNALLKFYEAERELQKVQAEMSKFRAGQDRYSRSVLHSLVKRTRTDLKLARDAMVALGLPTARQMRLLRAWNELNEEAAELEREMSKGEKRDV